eukprot:scaffold493385_cov18-Prasinocladus_malaysianus.AAC.2
MATMFMGCCTLHAVSKTSLGQSFLSLAQNNDSTLCRNSAPINIGCQLAAGSIETPPYAMFKVVVDDAFTYLYDRRGQHIRILNSLLAITFLRLDADKKESSPAACFLMSNSKQ